MQHKINKENLAIALKKSKLDFLEFLNKFVRYHVTEGNKKVDPQDTNTYNWIKNIYNNNQDHYKENTINTLSKILCTDLRLLIQNDQIDFFNKDYQQFLRARVINFLKTQNIINIENFKKDINTDINNILEGL